MSKAKEDSGALKEPDFGTEYAKSKNSSCKQCKEKIAKDSLRMSIRKKSRFFDGLQDDWHHFNCFWKCVEVKDLSEGNIKNLEQIKWEDQEKIRAKIAEIKGDGSEIAKSNGEQCFKCKKEVQKGEVSIKYFHLFYHPECFKKLNMPNIFADYFKGFDDLDREQRKTLIDLFGISKKRKSDSTDDETPEKKLRMGIDDDLKIKLKKQSETFWQVKQDIEKNLTREEIDKILQTNGRFRRKKGGPDAANEQLADCIIFGVPVKCPECEGGIFFYNGGSHRYECRGKISAYTRCTYVNKNPRRTPFIMPNDVKKANEFLKKHKFPTLKKRYYAPGTEVVNSVKEEDALEKLKKKREAQEAETKSGKAAFVKNGCSIDADCEVAEFSHVFIENLNEEQVAWQATLGRSSISEDRNSYYKLQLLEHDKRKEYYLFRSWGRIGSAQGGHKTEYFDDDLEKTKNEFKKLFKEKSGNNWSRRHQFRKIYGRLDLLEMDLDGKDSKIPAVNLENSRSKLAKSVQELIAMIFDVRAINDTLKALNLDTEKMPLGKLSVAHLRNAYWILTDLAEKVEYGATKSTILDASNRFYTMIPHVAGSSTLPMLDNMEIIREKTKMLDELMDLELAYSVVNYDAENDLDMKESDRPDPIDSYYKKLNCEIGVLDETSKEYETIKDYVKKTHAPTHSGYKLKISDIYEIKKEGEYKKFKKEIGNVNLLWHGSRTSNYAGILNQGLRIAPPEAPVNGYMFGKGVYFADMVSKSANYCRVEPGTQKEPNEGLLLLCDVALGEIQEERRANGNIRKPNYGKSSVKGLGEIVPDEKEHQTLDDGVIVPMGKPKKAAQKPGDLIHNEYIVYDVAQIKMRYLVKVKFV
uniref:Poly [ADP-ribose] polymerase n=2 Tax=Panagrolaimus sp. JU765 TaxID=591449 RepID=A0AC34QS04_9BILA